MGLRRCKAHFPIHLWLFLHLYAFEFWDSWSWPTTALINPICLIHWVFIYVCLLSVLPMAGQCLRQPHPGSYSLLLLRPAVHLHNLLSTGQVTMSTNFFVRVAFNRGVCWSHLSYMSSLCVVVTRPHPITRQTLAATQRLVCTLRTCMDW